MIKIFNILFLIAIISGCGIKRNFESDYLVTQNGILSMTVDRIYYNENSRLFRVWITLENLTNRSVEIGYNSFKATAYDTSYSGALLDRKAKTEDYFVLPPKATQKLNRAVQFTEVPWSRQIRFALEGAKFQGELEGSISVEISIPIEDY